MAFARRRSSMGFALAAILIPAVAWARTIEVGWTVSVSGANGDGVISGTFGRFDVVFPGEKFTLPADLTATTTGFTSPLFPNATWMIGSLSSYPAGGPVSLAFVDPIQVSLVPNQPGDSFFIASEGSLPCGAGEACAFATLEQDFLVPPVVQAIRSNGASTIATSSGPFVYVVRPIAGGTYPFPVDGDGEIWQPGRLLDGCASEPSLFEVCVSVDTSTDNEGRVSGTGLIGFSGSLSGLSPYGVTGQVSGTTAKTKASLVGDFAGSAVFHSTSGPVAVDLEGDVRFRCKENPDDRTEFACKARFNVCAFLAGKKQFCRRVHGEIPLEAVGAPWMLTVDLSTVDDGPVAGTGFLDRGTDQRSQIDLGSLDYTAVGTYKASKDIAKLLLVGVQSPDSKIKISKLALRDPRGPGGKVSFKVAGQKGRAEIQPAP